MAKATCKPSDLPKINRDHGPRANRVVEKMQKKVCSDYCVKVNGKPRILPDKWQAAIRAANFVSHQCDMPWSYRAIANLFRQWRLEMPPNTDAS